MGFKVASRVRGLSDEAFSRSLYEEQCRSALVPAALAGRLRLPLPAAHRGALCAGRPLQCYRCKKQTSLHGGHDLPRHQAAADAWFGRPPDRNGPFPRSNWGAVSGSSSRPPGPEAQDHGGDGAARGRHAAYGAGGDGRAYLGGARAGGKRGRGARDALRGGGLHQPRGPAAQVKLVAGQGLPQARDRARRQALAGPQDHGRPALPHSKTSHQRDPHLDRPPAWPFKWVNTTLGNIKSAITGTTESSAPITPNATSPASPYNRRYSSRHHDPALRS